jgi:hypothetical protein
MEYVYKNVLQISHLKGPEEDGRILLNESRSFIIVIVLQVLLR